MKQLKCWGRVFRDETKHGCEGNQLSTEVTRRFNRYFSNNSNNKKKKKKKINIVTIININIDNNNNNNNSNEDLDQLLITEPQYRF